MTDVLESEITVEELRGVVRAKREAGINSRVISMLIAAYAELGTGEGRHDGGVPRLPLETVPSDKRASFLVALKALRNEAA
jgi:hypothetical protein